MNAVLSAINRHREAFSAWKAVLNALGNDNPDTCRASRSERAALDDLFAAPVRSMDEASAKAAYLLDEVDQVSDYFAENDSDVAVVVLTSFRQPAVSSEPEPFLIRLETYQSERAGLFSDEVGGGDAYAAELDAVEARLFDNMPPITTAAGALAALRQGIVEQDGFCVERVGTLFRAVEAYLDQKSNGVEQDG